MADNGIRRTENANGVPQLKPCPFCGGEAHPMAQHWDDGSHVWWVECKVCGAEGKRCDDGLEAIDAWNTRVERTCEFKPFKGPISDTDEEGNRQGVCSVCSAYMHEQFCYCPNCGRKVVER